MYLNENIHAVVSGNGFQFCGLAIIQRGHDQKYAIGAERPRFDNLIRIEHEVLT